MRLRMDDMDSDSIYCGATTWFVRSDDIHRVLACCGELAGHDGCHADYDVLYPYDEPFVWTQSTDREPGPLVRAARDYWAKRDNPGAYGCTI